MNSKKKLNRICGQTDIMNAPNKSLQSYFQNKIFFLDLGSNIRNVNIRNIAKRQILESDF